MRFTIRRAGPITVLAFKGEMTDLLDCGALVIALLAARARGVQDLILDISRVDFINSAGLALLLFTKETWMDAAGRLTVYGPSVRLKSPLLVCKLNDQFRCFQTIEEAVAGLFDNQDLRPSA